MLFTNRIGITNNESHFHSELKQVETVSRSEIQEIDFKTICHALEIGQEIYETISDLQLMG